MTTIQFFYIYLMAVPVFFIIDLIWLGVVARGFYQSQIGFLLGPVNWTAAIIFYLIFIFGIILFAVQPGLLASSLTKTILLGAAFGFIAYATYDLTNLSTLKDWPIKVVIVDIIWGAFLSASVAGVTYWLGKTFVL